MNKDFLVSIIAPCYNGEKYLPYFLDSVLAQTYKNIELILVNDASTDKTQEIICDYKYLLENAKIQFKIINKAKNGGQAAAINEALPSFMGKYMMWMDSDDILYPNAIEEKVEFLKKNPQLDFCLCCGDIVNSPNLEKIVGKLQRTEPGENDDLFEDLIKCNNVVFNPGTIFVKSDSFKKAIPSLHVFESREGQNWQLMLPLAYLLKYGYLNKSLFKYVVHCDSHSHSKRNYRQKINREDNFILLLSETIKNIPDIQNLLYYLDLVNVVHTKTKMHIAITYLKYFQYLKYKKVLKKYNVKIPFKKTFIPSLIICALQKLKRFFKKNLV